MIDIELKKKYRPKGDSIMRTDKAMGVRVLVGDEEMQENVDEKSKLAGNVEEK